MRNATTVRTWRYLWSLIRYRGRVFVGTAVLSLIMFLVPISQGLVTKAVFDSLTHHASVSIGLWELLALLVGIAAVSLSMPQLWRQG